MLENWLQPTDFIKKNYNEDQIGGNTQFYNKKFPILDQVQIAIIGLSEEEANGVRTHFYPLAHHFPNLKIADLGNARKTDTNFLIPLLKELLQSHIFPILIGNDLSLLKAQQQAHKQSVKSPRNWVSIDDRVRYDANFKTGFCQIIGSQIHFSSPSEVTKVEQKGWDYLSLGKARSDLKQVEPLLRDADFLTINLAAMKAIEAPAQTASSPNGFWLEEICQLTRYAGMSDKLASLGIYGFKVEGATDRLTTQSVAQIIWYALDGFYNRKQDYPFQKDNLMEYTVAVKDHNIEITFWKSMTTARWWLQLPHQKTNVHLIPCAYEDYKLAANGEISDRLMTILRRFE